MANPITVSTRPQYLNAATLTFNAWDLRRYMDGPPPGPGVFGYEDWRVLPKQSGVNLSVDVGKTGVGLMQGWVRGSTRGGQGLYRIDNVDVNAPTADTYTAQFNVDVTSNSSGNPRIDIVVLEVLDAQHTGASSLAQIRVITGTPTAAATLDNRSGAAATPTSAILLADIIIANLDVTVDAVDIRDRRQWPLQGANPQPLTTPVDMVALIPSPAVRVGTFTIVPTTNDNQQSAALMYLPRRIVGATRLRWRGSQTATNNTASFNFAIVDASGRLIVTTGATAFNAVASATTSYSTAIAATTFEAGWYYVWFGTGAATAASGLNYNGVLCQVDPATSGITAVASQNQAFRSAAGGTTFPAANTILGMTDIVTISAVTASLGIPIPVLSVG